MLGSAYATIPASDMDAAKKFYEETLGLEKGDEDEAGGIFYHTGSSKIYVYKSEYAGTNQATTAGWDVDDVAATVEALKSKGVSFEHYDYPGTTREGDVHTMGNIKAAWFKDPSGNILAIGSQG